MRVACIFEEEGCISFCGAVSFESTGKRNEFFLAVGDQGFARAANQRGGVQPTGEGIMRNSVCVYMVIAKVA